MMTVDAEGGWRPRRWWILAAGAVVFLAAAAAVALLARDEPAEPTRSELPEAPAAAPDTDSRELLDLLERGRAQTFHARYTATTPDEADATTRLELWRDGQRVRQDSVVEAPDGTVRTASIRDPDDRVVSCVQRDGGDWNCGPPSQTSGDQDLFGSVADQLSGADVTVTDAQVAGHDARCFTLTDATATSELCVTDEGIPVRLAAGDEAEMTLDELDRDVDASVFTPPAEPAAAQEG